jgi:predicted DNA-binding transcriptional regulator AlpA
MPGEPHWPEWMDQKVLAAYIGKKSSTVRTLMKHGALPRPSRWGNTSCGIDRRSIASLCAAVRSLRSQ